MDNVVDSQFITDTVKQLNRCIRDWYYDEYPGKKNINTRLEFKACCNEDEIRIILQCANIYLENNPTANKKDVLVAIISYYYEIQVLEYYLGDWEGVNFDCIKELNESSETIYQIRDKIITSDDPWASQIRRIILNINVGGRRNKKQKTRKYRYSKKYNLKKRKNNNKKRKNKTLKKRNI